MIVDGESGADARRMEFEWARSLAVSARPRAPPAFVKQLGTAHGPNGGSEINTWPVTLQIR